MGCVCSFLQRRLIEEIYGDAQPINQANKIPSKDTKVQISRPVGQSEAQVSVSILSVWLVRTQTIRAFLRLQQRVWSLILLQR